MTPEVKRHYVYKLAYPESMGGYVFYVGAGKGYRMDEHEKAARRSKLSRGENKYKIGVIRKIWKNGEQVVKTQVAFFETREEALLYEIALIMLMKPYGRLTNLTDGGEGGRGRECTEEHRYKISEAQKEWYLTKQGRAHLQKMRKLRASKPVSEETRRKISDANKRRIRSEGRNLSEETYRKHSEAMKRWALTEEGRAHLQKMRAARAQKMDASYHHSEETRRKISEGHKGKSHSEETRRKIGKASKGRVKSEETLRKLSEAHNRRRPYPESHRSAASESNRTRPYTENQRRAIAESNRRRAAQKHQQALHRMRYPIISPTDAEWKQGVTALSLWEEAD